METEKLSLFKINHHHYLLKLESSPLKKSSGLKQLLILVSDVSLLSSLLSEFPSFLILHLVFFNSDLLHGKLNSHDMGLQVKGEGKDEKHIQKLIRKKTTITDVY